jgi:hypothetical protein
MAKGFGHFESPIRSKQNNSHLLPFYVCRLTKNLRGLQYSTYRLQLPYKYSIPLIIVSIVLHWLLSNSLYLMASGGSRYHPSWMDPRKLYANLNTPRLCEAKRAIRRHLAVSDCNICRIQRNSGNCIVCSLRGGQHGPHRTRIPQTPQRHEQHGKQLARPVCCLPRLHSFRCSQASSAIRRFTSIILPQSPVRI